MADRTPSLDLNFSDPNVRDEVTLGLRRRDGNQRTIYADGDRGNMHLGGNGVDGDVLLYQSTIDETEESSATIHLDAGTGRILSVGGELAVAGDSGDAKVRLRDGEGGLLTVHNNIGDPIISLNGKNGVLNVLGARTGKPLRQIIQLNGENATLTIGNQDSAGHLRLRNSEGKRTIALDGETGDITLVNGDCAEEFDVEQDPALAPGSVLVIREEGRLELCRRAYDRRVAGVVAGAGDCRPAILLGRQSPNPSKHRRPVALAGRVYCQVDATHGPVQIGDLLTTSPTAGFAMGVRDSAKAFGAVLGKALAPLTHGTGQVPILVALQ